MKSVLLFFLLTLAISPIAEARGRTYLPGRISKERIEQQKREAEKAKTFFIYFWGAVISIGSCWFIASVAESIVSTPKKGRPV
ncbi:MAG: hypothetical protein Q8L64_06335 [bacterium]|nr:hypothetical protein [bacterium]